MEIYKDYKEELNFNNKLVFKILIIFLIYYIVIKNNLFYYFPLKKSNIDIKENIIEFNYYDKFESIKQYYYKDSFFRPFLDQIKIINYIYNKNNNIMLSNLTNVHISFAFNNNYLYPILILAKSILTNTNPEYTFVSFHFLCTPDIDQNSITVLKSLMNKSINTELIFYNMSNSFINYKSERYSQATYFRLLIPIIIQANKIIYLDADTLALKDITDMYKLDMKDNYAMGFYDYQKGYRREKRTKKYINCGVMLLNLEKIRNDKKTYDLLNMTINGTKLPKHDQTIINYSFYPKIGILPIKYGIWNFQNDFELLKFIKRLKRKINEKEFKNALKDPSLLHNVRCHPKIWYTNYKYRGIHNLEFQRFHNFWYKYANETEYINEIKKLYDNH